MSGLNRPVTFFESPYQMQPGEDIELLYERLLDANVGKTFIVITAEGLRLTMAYLMEQHAG